MNIRIVHRLPGLTALAVASCLAVPLPVLAQKSLGGGSGSGPIMTLDELRNCMRIQSTLKTQAEQIEVDKAETERERVAIDAEKAAVETDREALKAQAAKVEDANKRLTALAERFNDWNQRWKEFEDAGRSGAMAERQRRKLNDESRALQQEKATIDAERAALQGSEQAAIALNARVEALNVRTAAWNGKRETLSQRSASMLQERDLWTSECGNRRYREDDEKAIRSGK